MSRCRNDAFHDCRFPLQLPLRPQQEFDIATTVAPPTWTVKDAEKLYNMSGWGLGYFRINPDGHVTVHPDANRKRGLDLYHLAIDLDAQGVGPAAAAPLLRHPALAHRGADRASSPTRSRSSSTTGSYTTVYPIKVNQQRHVVEEIVEFGDAHGVGLECGSKPELQAVLGPHESTDHLIVCNGYKDEEFMRLALMGQKLGHKVFIVLEQLSEIDVLLQVADELGVTPTAGVRIKLATEGSGRWAKSGGEKSKFGLNAAQLMKLLDRAGAAGAAGHPQADPLPSRQPDHRHPLHQGRAGGDRPLLRRAAGHGLRHHPRGRRRRPRRRLRRHQLDPAGERELLAAGVRERRHLHASAKRAASRSCRCRTSSASRAARSPRITRCCCSR